MNSLHLPRGLGASVCRVSSIPPTLWLAFVISACGVLSQEEQLLTDFFEAARLHDTTAVAKIAAVTFNPRTDGVVDAFEVQDVADAGDMKRVTIRASVRQLEGSTTDQTLVFTLARKDQRWFIAGISVP